MKIFNKNFLLFIFLFIFSFYTNFCLAENLLDIPEIPTAPPASIPSYLILIFRIGMGIGFFSVVISLVVSGALYILSNAIASMRSKAKDWLSGAITGFIILILLYLILRTIYPDLTIFKLGRPSLSIPQLPAGQRIEHGVYLYEKGGCSGEKFPVYISNANLVSTNKNGMKSVGIKQDGQNNIYHVAVAYDAVNFYGKCQYINPNVPCEEITLPTLGSISTHIYSRNPSGDIIIYRHGAGGEKGFNKKGGYLVLSAGTIGSIYTEDLKKLSFTGNNIGSNNLDDCTVPPDEQDCKTWDKNGKCKEKKCPSLYGKNIGAIEIQGEYLVLLVSGWKKNGGALTSDFCQAYPKIDDKNKLGPKQVKWDAINTHINYLPKSITVIPIDKK